MQCQVPKLKHHTFVHQIKYHACHIPTQYTEFSHCNADKYNPLYSYMSQYTYINFVMLVLVAITCWLALKQLSSMSTGI